ncbi:MAG: hypothetical protein ABSE73_32155 [Planctomycetota bacterium]
MQDNLDGEALTWAAGRLAARVILRREPLRAVPEQRRVVFGHHRFVRPHLIQPPDRLAVHHDWIAFRASFLLPFPRLRQPVRDAALAAAKRDAQVAQRHVAAREHAGDTRQQHQFLAGGWGCWFL